MKVSACVITKNEEKNLPRWLDCVRRLADEIIVVDTGSTDGTAELARAGGAKLFYFAWCDDFAAAKNYALEQATGEWIVNLDADEYFLAEDCPKVRDLIRRYHPNRRVGGLLFPCINIDPDREDRYINRTILLRVFRNSPSLRYEGRIHELVVSRGKHRPEMKMVVDIMIRHTGYRASLSEAKARRNLAILLAEQKRRGERPSDDFYLADCFISLGEYDKALACARRTVAGPVRFLGMTNHPWLMLIKLLMAQGHSSVEVEAAVAQAREKFPELPEFPMMGGFAAYQKGAYHEAERALQQGLNLYRRQQAQPNQDMYVGDQATNLLPQVYDYLGRLAVLRGALEEATEHFGASLRLERSDEVLDRLLRALRGRPSSEAITCLNLIIAEEKEAAWLAEKLYHHGLAAALYYERLSGEKACSAFDSHVYAGDDEAAAKMAVDGAAAYVALGEWLALRLPAPGALALLLPHAMGDERLRERMERELS